jgi:hypothetical protein
MKAILILTLAIAALTGCAVKGDPIELSKACAVENDGKNFQVTGTLSARTSVYCSNRAKRMECGFDVLEAAGGEKKMGADIEVGSGANTMDEVPKSYKKEELKVRDNASNPVAIGTDQVKMTGRLSVSPDAKACFMQVYKIEK